MKNLDAYLDHIRNDYANWGRHGGEPATESAKIVRDQMVREFNERLTYKVGKKYIKIISDGSVHSFIVVADAGKFRAGDILKAASWAAPATNFVRGNVLDGDWKRVTWTGAA